MYLGDNEYYYGYFKNGKYNGKGILYKKFKDVVYTNGSLEKEVFYIGNEEKMKNELNNITIIN